MNEMLFIIIEARFEGLLAVMQYCYIMWNAGGDRFVNCPDELYLTI